MSTKHQVKSKARQVFSPFEQKVYWMQAEKPLNWCKLKISLPPDMM